MESYDFEKICKNAIIKYYEENSEITDNVHLTIKDIYVVWQCKTLQNNKHLSSWLTFHRRGMTKWSPNSNAWNP